MTELDKAETLAKIAYQAYGKSTDFKNYQGAPMPCWDELPSSIKVAWTLAVQMTVSGFPPAGSEISCRCYWIVEAGVVPGIPQPELTKNFGISSVEQKIGQ